MVAGLFDSVVFLFTFLPVVLFLYYLMPGQLKNALLLLASLVFYAWGEPVAVFLMVGMALFTYACGLRLAGVLKNRRRARAVMRFGVGINLGVLVFFLYGRTVLAGLQAVLPVDIPFQGFAMPMGCLSIHFRCYRISWMFTGGMQRCRRIRLTLSCMCLCS